MKQKALHLLGFALVCLLAAGCLCACGSGALDSTGGDSQKSSVSQDKSSKASQGQIQVEFTVDATAADKGILTSTTLSLEKDASVFDALKASGISFVGNKDNVESIGGIAQGDFGAMSGWMFSVNDETPMELCGDVTLKDGDVVCWYYATEF